MADIKLKNTANTEFSISHNGTRGAKAVTSDQIVVAVETIEDFPASPEIGDTVIVKDLNRGGTFIYDDTQSAVNNGGTVFDGWVRQYSGAVNVKWFGASILRTDNNVPIQLALSSFNVVVTDKEYVTEATIVIASGKKLLGENYVTSQIIISTDNVAIQLLGAFSEAHNILVKSSGTHTKNLVEIGSALTRSDRAHVSNLYVTDAGNDGIQVINGNLGTIENIRSTNNGNDGINFNRDISADNHNWTLQGYIDCIENTRDGLHVDSGIAASDTNASKSHFISATCQGNGRYGLYVGSRSNLIQIYAENNGTRDIYIDTYGYGNKIDIVEGTHTNNGTGNTISNHSANANYLRSIKGLWLMQGGTGGGYSILDDDGTAGVYNVEKSAIRRINHNYHGSSGQWDVYHQNTGGGTLVFRIGGRLFPTVDNSYTIGDASVRWATIYAGTGTINTSDDREKTYRDITEAETLVAKELKSLMKSFKFNDSIEEKGIDKARIHYGTSAQSVKATFEKHGLVADDYAILCYDEWEAEYEQVIDVEAELDEEGNIIKEATYKNGDLIREAGDRYGIRYEELLCFIISAM